MVGFTIGYNRYDDGQSNPLVEKLVKTLNEIFGSKECPFHNGEKWFIEVDLMKNGHLQFATKKVNGCSWGLTLLDEDIYPYLGRQKIFPLPSH